VDGAVSGQPAHDLLAPALLSLIAAVRETAARLTPAAPPRPRNSASLSSPSASASASAAAAESAAEAIHDFRVALRRLRTLLRPARSIYGKKRLRLIAAELRRFAQAAGSVRDEEVLRETLTALPVSPTARRALDAWAPIRARRERTLRRAVVRLIAARGPDLAAARAPGEEPPPSLEQALTALTDRIEHIAHSPAPSHAQARNRSAEELARETIERALAAVASASRDPDPADAAAMHALRILYKRLRYTAELFAPAIGDESRAIAKRAAHMQKRLGELHDLDEARTHVRRARALPRRAREATLRAIRHARVELAERVRRELRGDPETPSPAAPG
jgi:CHAD domain-containing protein